MQYQKYDTAGQLLSSHIMRRRILPPLKALRVFEAAARHRSFSKAADELFVTRPAVAQQVRKLEEYLGYPLFVWTSRSNTLTHAGEELMRNLEAGFDLLETAVNRAKLVRDREAVTVNACPDFMAKWLVPRLKYFCALYPSININISPSARLPNLRNGSVDLAIHYCSGVLSEFRVDRLFGESLFPVHAPAMANHLDQIIRTPRDLKRHLLLHDGTVPPDGELPGWNDWFETAGVASAMPLTGPTISPSSVVIQAAIDGMGIALARSVLVKDDLASGRLVRPFDVEVDSMLSYHVVSMRATIDRTAVSIFRNWLLETASRDSTCQSDRCIDLVM